MHSCSALYLIREFIFPLLHMRHGLFLRHMKRRTSLKAATPSYHLWKRRIAKMKISGYSLIDHLQQTALNAFAAAYSYPKSRAKTAALAMVLFPVLAATLGIMVKYNLNPFRI